MTNVDVIKKFLPEHLWEIAETFDIPEDYLKSDIDLVVMVLESKSIDSQDEKQNWFNLMPLMNTEQLEKLRKILLKEKNKLQEIEEKYESKKTEIKNKYLDNREEGGVNEKMKEIKSEEKKIAEQDAEDAEDLLDMI